MFLFYKFISFGVIVGGINKVIFDGLCNLVFIESDKKLIKYVVCVVRNLFAEKVFRDYGIFNYGKLRIEVEEVL